jgi:hypothetical protein
MLVPAGGIVKSGTARPDEDARYQGVPEIQLSELSPYLSVGAYDQHLTGQNSPTGIGLI